MNSLKEDIKFGALIEKIAIDKLQKHFNETITQYSDKFSKYDAFSDTAKYEVKSRRNSFNTYPTTLITLKKVDNVEGLLRFVFLFTDCMAYIEYNKELFDTFEKSPIIYRRVGGNPSAVMHILIPINHLIKIN